MRLAVSVLILGIILTGCSSRSSQPATSPNSPYSLSTFILTSSAFENSQPIPEPYTCSGKNISPELSWAGAPSNVQSFAITLEDPDARGFVHWVIWNLPRGTADIPEGSVPEGSIQGTNGFNKIGYGGPCPPSGTHHYYFKLYALDQMLDLPEGAKLKDLQAAMNGHILAETELIGTFTHR